MNGSARTGRQWKICRRLPGDDVGHTQFPERFIYQGSRGERRATFVCIYRPLLLLSHLCNMQMLQAKSSTCTDLQHMHY